jgi:uncharacterized RDD family membrane protein YckC
MTIEIYGGFWRRFFAFLIDKIIIYALSINICVVAIFAVGLGSDMREIMSSTPQEISGRIGAFMSLCIFLSLLADMVYFTLFHGISGQTPGKMLLRLQVVAASGAPITTGTAFLRWVGYLISGFFFCLGFLWIAFDRKKQGWHDKIAMTSVIYKQKTPAITGDPHPDESGKPPENPQDALTLSPASVEGIEQGNLFPVSDESEDQNSQLHL